MVRSLLVPLVLATACADIAASAPGGLDAGPEEDQSEVDECPAGHFPDGDSCSSYADKAFLRLNVGGPAYDGTRDWKADTSPPTTALVFSTSKTLRTGASFPNNSGDLVVVLGSGRWWDIAAGQRASARLLVANGTYAVRFLVCEGVWSAAGQRVFGFEVEGVRRDSAIDPFGLTGGKNIGVWREYGSIQVTDGSLDLAWPAIVDNPEIRAIEIARVSEAVRFPRLSAYAIGNPHSYDTAAFRDRARRHHIVVVGQWPGWQAGRSMTMAEVMRDIKTRSSVGTRLFIYANTMELRDPTASSEAYYAVWQKLNLEKWWLYANGTSGNPVRSTYGNGDFGVINNTALGLTDASGRNYMKWRTDYDHAFKVQGDARNAANPYVDGFFQDNVFWKPRVDGDWNRDGVLDDQDDPVVQGWLRAGYKDYFDYIRAKWPGSIQIGNIADWGHPEAVIGVLDQALDGGIMEGIVGQSWSVESYAGFAAMMKAYHKMYDAIGPRKLVTFHHSAWTAGDYRSMRYSLAACLMGDAYYFISGTSYSPAELLWFDEFDFDLGYPRQTRRTAAWSNGVWRRDFDNGIALVNPKGNGTRTVELGGSFRKLSGTQSAVNDGATVTSVTLADRDGIILRRP